MVVHPVELPRLEGWARDALHRFLQQWKEYCQKCAVNSQNAVGLATLLTEHQLDTLAKMTDKPVGSITNKDVEEFIKERLKTGPSDAALTWLHITNKSCNLRVKKDGTGPVMEWFEDLRKRLSLNGIKDDFFEDNPKMAKKRNDIAVSRIMPEEARTYVISNLQVNAKVVDTVVPFEKDLARLLNEWTKTNVVGNFVNFPSDTLSREYNFIESEEDSEVSHRPGAQRSRFGTSQTSRSQSSRDGDRRDRRQSGSRVSFQEPEQNLPEEDDSWRRTPTHERSSRGYGSGGSGQRGRGRGGTERRMSYSRISPPRREEDYTEHRSSTRRHDHGRDGSRGGADRNHDATRVPEDPRIGGRRRQRPTGFDCLECGGNHLLRDCAEFKRRIPNGS